MEQFSTPTQPGQDQSLAREKIEQVWARRAAQMAKVEAETTTDDQILSVVIRLGRELLALEVQYVKDIRPREAITRIPRVPAWVIGVINLRGRILSVVDLRQYLGLPEDAANSGSGYLVISENKDMEVVFLVDDIPGVELLPVREKALEDGILHGLRTEYIAGIAERKTVNKAGKVTKQHVTLLNANALLSDPRLIIHQELS